MLHSVSSHHRKNWFLPLCQESLLVTMIIHNCSPGTMCVLVCRWSCLRSLVCNRKWRRPHTGQARHDRLQRRALIRADQTQAQLKCFVYSVGMMENEAKNNSCHQLVSSIEIVSLREDFCCYAPAGGGGYIHARHTHTHTHTALSLSLSLSLSPSLSLSLSLTHTHTPRHACAYRQTDRGLRGNEYVYYIHNRRQLALHIRIVCVLYRSPFRTNPARFILSQALLLRVSAAQSGVITDNISNTRFCSLVSRCVSQWS
jgi:hypothetical protein